MKQCSSCRGDGLKHPHADIFQIVEDRPCRECNGKGAVQGIPNVFENLSDVPYMEDTVTIQKEYPVRIYYSPFEDIGVEIVETLIAVGQSWYILNLTDDQLESYADKIERTLL